MPATPGAHSVREQDNRDGGHVEYPVRVQVWGAFWHVTMGSDK